MTGNRFALIGRRPGPYTHAVNECTQNCSNFVVYLETYCAALMNSCLRVYADD